MKKSKTNAIAKKAKKAFKKDLSDKIAAQIKTLVNQVEPGLKKAEKSIEKAAKNLAKKLARLTTDKTTKLPLPKKPAPVSFAKTPVLPPKAESAKATTPSPVK